MSLEPRAADRLPVSLCCSTVLPLVHDIAIPPLETKTTVLKTRDCCKNSQSLTFIRAKICSLVATMPRHTRQNPGHGSLYTADDLPRRIRAPQWHRARAPFNSRGALEAYIGQQNLPRDRYDNLRATARTHGLALPLWNYKRGNPPQALSLFFNQAILRAQCPNIKSVHRDRDPANRRYVMHNRVTRCGNNENSLGVDFKECEGYKTGLDVRMPHGPAYIVCTECAESEAEHCDFTKWEPSSILPYCRRCCEGRQTPHFASRNYRRRGGYGTPGVRICKCSEEARALHLCWDCRAEWHQQTIYNITINARNRLHQYQRNGAHQGVLDPYVKDDLDPAHANCWRQRRFLSDRSRCICGRRWQQVKRSWDGRRTKEKNEAMLRECLNCCKHVPVEDLPRWPNANDCSARFWDTEAPAQQLNRNYT